MGEISKNIFSKGLNRDYDPTNVSSQSMIDNINGKLMFNKRGTLDWVEDNGNTVSFTLDGNDGADANRYIPIGYTGDGNIKIIFSVRVDETLSEIGILGTDSEGNGTYKTLFNDTNQTEKLNFKKTNQICARFLYENNKTIRVYWVDGVETDSNRPRVFTFEFNESIGEKNNVNAYSAVTATVHDMNSQADFNIGIIKFVKTINGGLLSGVYQYTYRLLTNSGYSTPWTTPTKKIFVTSDEVNSSNWNAYEMEGSGIDTPKGNQIEVKGIDQRYDRIQVAYLYSKTNSVVDSSNIFIETAIDKTVGVDSATFDHLNNDGEPLITATIAERFQGIGAAKTLDIKDSVLYYGNINENILEITSEEIENVLSGLTITPKFRGMISDTLGLAPTSPPLTNQPTMTTDTIKRLNQSDIEAYTINDDYANYKGTQVEHLYTGYFRGEVYRFAILFYDKIGNPYFAFHLADFQFPEQHDTDYNWRRLKLDGTVVNGSGSLSYPASTTNDYYNANLNVTSILNNNTYNNTNYCQLRIMGIEVGGINITGIKDKISGFSIVRTDRHKTILHQGFVLPVVNNVAIGGESRPHPVGHQRYDNTTGVTNGLLYGCSYSNNGNDKYKTRPNQTILHAPDNDFDPTTIPTVQSSDRLKIVGSCYVGGSISNNGSYYNNAAQTYSNGTNNVNSPCVISKWYRSYNTSHDSITSNIRPQYGNYATISYQLNIAKGQTIPDYETGLTFKNLVFFKTPAYADSEENFGNTNDEYYGSAKNSIFYKHGNWLPNNATSSCFAYDGTNNSTFAHNTQAGALICNYTRNNQNQLPNNAYGGLTQSSLEQTVFYSTGHFQPVNNITFGTPNNDTYNQIEVYGGDCYLDFVGFLRVYGRINGNNYNTDVSYGVVFPLESVNNYSLRQAASILNPMYTDVGARPGRTQDGQDNAFPNGLFDNSNGSLIEEFNYNDVLTFSELTSFFASVPIGFQNINQYPVRWRHTKNKFYGDTIDTWRSFEVNSFEDLMGVHGPITSSTFLFNQIYSLQEKAFGRLRAFDRAALESETTQSLTTGVGPALDGIDYISTSVGNQNQWSLVNTGKAFYWIDVFNGKAMRFAQDGLNYLSDQRGMHSFFERESKYFLNKDNPAFGEGISGAWNSKDRDVLWTFNRDEYISTGANLVVTSDIIDSVNHYSNNETVFVHWTGASTVNNGIILPVEANTVGNNYNVLQYVSLKTGSNLMFVNQVKNNVVTPLAQIGAGQNYLFYRNSSSDDWSYTLLADKSKITPFRATVVYSEYIQSFTQFHSFKPNFYISHNKFLITEQADVVSKQFFVHGKNLLHANYYGQNWKTSLRVTVSDNGEFAKIFDSVRLAVNKQGSEKLNNFIFSTEEQKRFYDVNQDGRVRFLEDNLRLPVRTETQPDRMRGRWLSMIFEFSNNTEYPIKIDNLINHYRLSNRK